MQSPGPSLSFFARLKLATRVLTDALFAQQIVAGLQAPEARPEAEIPAVAPAPAVPAHQQHASGLAVLGLLQREGRLIDFLQEDVAAFSDAEIGAAARVVHAGSRKVLTQYLSLEPVLPDSEGASVTIKAGFDAQRIRLTGNVAGQPPFRGALKHHGWYASDVRLPSSSDAVDPRVIAPAEVEL